MVAAALASGLVWQLEWLSPQPLGPLRFPAVPFQLAPSTLLPVSLYALHVIERGCIYEWADSYTPPRLQWQCDPESFLTA